MTAAEIVREFRAQNGHLPGSREIDLLAREHMQIKTSRRIQQLGGLKAWYAGMGFRYSDARTGKRRMATALQSWKLSIQQDKEIGDWLIERFGEVNVHFQARYLNDGLHSHSCDFRVYRNGKEAFNLDMFHARDEGTMRGCFAHKINRFKKIGYAPTVPAYLVSMNDEVMGRPEIDAYLASRKTPLHPLIQLRTYAEFKAEVSCTNN